MVINKNFYFSLHSSIVPVSGFKNSILCNLENNTYREIPNDLCDIFSNYSNKKIIEVYNAYPEEKDYIDEVFNFLIENQYIFISEFKSNIIPLDFENIQFSEDINNAIIDIDKDSDIEDIFVFLNQICNLGCKNISVRFINNYINTEILLKILEYIKSTTVRYCELTLDYFSLEDDEYFRLLEENSRVFIVWLYNSEQEKQVVVSHQSVVYLKDEIINSGSCGKISPKYFFSDINTFALNKNANSCLFGKISLDSNGIVKNCPSLQKEYGNIKNVSISKIVDLPEYNKITRINRDQIKICKDCEFRYICSDCRAFLNDIYEKPYKCKYNPYEGLWEE